MKRCVLAVIFMLGGAGCTSSGPNLESIEEVLAFAAQKAEEIQTWSVDTEATISIGDFDLDFTGSMLGKGDRTVAMFELKDQGQHVKARTVIDFHGTRWIEIDTMGQKQYSKSHFPWLGTEPTGVSQPIAGVTRGGSLNPMKVLGDYVDVCDFELSGRKIFKGEWVYLITGISKEELNEPVVESPLVVQIRALVRKVTISIGVKDGFVRELKIFGPDDMLLTRMRYKNVVLNEPLDDSLFEIILPEGVEVIDETKESNEELAGMINEAMDNDSQ